MKGISPHAVAVKLPEMIGDIVGGQIDVPWSPARGLPTRQTIDSG